MLAPFLDPDELTAIIGTDLFGDPAQVPGFAALMSDTDKPFECVGERRESAVALRLLAGRPGVAEHGGGGSPGAGGRPALVDDGDVADLLDPEPELAFDDPVVAAAVDARLTGDQ